MTLTGNAAFEYIIKTFYGKRDHHVFHLFSRGA
jgi:hypothetical protein